MANGIYVAVSGSIARLDQLDVLANDLANVKTPGFKQDTVTFESVRADVAAAIANGDVDAETVLDKDFVQATDTYARLDQGPLQKTGNPLDIALMGNGFLRVQTPRGERLTRNGRLMVARDGALKTLRGNPVLDARGRAIQIPPATAPEISSDGIVRNSEGAPLARLGIRAVSIDARLLKDKDGLLTPEPPKAGEAGPPQVANAWEVMQGYVEQSNGSAVKLMTELIEVQRNFEALHQVISTSAEMDRTASRLTG